MSYSPFSHIGSILWKRRPIHLTLFLTSRCNSKCGFCFYRTDDHAEKEGIAEISLKEIRKISGSMGRLLWLALSGGEIFLRNDLAEIVKVFYKQNSPSIILLPTNGLLTDLIKEKVEEVLRSCPQSTVAVKLSLDGDEDLHDRLRGVKGGFSKTLETYNALGGLLDKYPNFELGINTVFCSENQDRMDWIIGFVNGLDRIKTHTVSLMRDAFSDKEHKGIDMAKYYKTIETLALNSRERASAMYSFRGAGLKAAQDILQRGIIYETVQEQKQIIPCYAGRLNIVITEKGDLYPCESFSMKMGNVRQAGYNVNKILRDGPAQKVIGSIRSGRCYCTHECYMMTNILFNPRMYPELLKEYMKL